MPPTPIQVECPECGASTDVMRLKYIFIRPFEYGSDMFNPERRLLKLVCGHEFNREHWRLTIWLKGKAKLIRKEEVG